MRHLHDKVKTLESRTAPPPEDTSASDSTSAAAAGLIMGGMMMTDTLMIQNGPVYGTFYVKPRQKFSAHKIIPPFPLSAYRCRLWCAWRHS